MNKGSAFDEFLAEEGILEDVEQTAKERVRTWITHGHYGGVDYRFIWSWTTDNDK